MSESNFNFREWVKIQVGPYTFHTVDHDHYTLETEYGIAEINFYSFEGEEEIVELRITNKKTNTTSFFLHFQPVDEEHSKDLFNEMVMSLVSLKDSHTTKILLFCSAGMTTSFFAQKMNELSNLMEIDFEFNAVSVNEVYQNAQDYEVILIAPQVAYEENNIKKRIKDKLILKIPTSIFAKYDANGCIEFVRDELKEYRSNKKKKSQECCSCCKEGSEGKFLVIATAPSDSETRINYRVYDNGEITINQTVIKRYLDINDIDDIIDIQVCQNKESSFDAISIAVPGVVLNGKLDLPPTHGSKIFSRPDQLYDMKKHFEQCVDIPVIIENNANCAALGWYQSQDQYQNICLMSQPNGWLIGGQGIVINGKMIRGAHGIAGELKYILNQLNYTSPLSLNPYHLDTIKEVVTKGILTNISIVDPEVIVLRCEMLPDVQEIHDELLKYLPEERIPDIIHIDEFNDYILLGQQKLCQDLYDKEREKDE